MPSDRLGCVRKHSDTFGKSRKNWSKNHRKNKVTKWENQNAIETKLTSVFVNKSFAQGQTIFSSDTDAVAAGAAAFVFTTVFTVVATVAAAPAATASVSEEKNV